MTKTLEQTMRLFIIDAKLLEVKKDVLQKFLKLNTDNLIDEIYKSIR